MGAVNSLVNPTAYGIVVGGGSCALCHSCLDFSVLSVVAGNFLGGLIGPHGGLSLRGGTDCSALLWNLELGVFCR